MHEKYVELSQIQTRNKGLEMLVILVIYDVYTVLNFFKIWYMSTMLIICEKHEIFYKQSEWVKPPPHPSSAPKIP